MCIAGSGADRFVHLTCAVGSCCTVTAVWEVNILRTVGEGSLRTLCRCLSRQTVVTHQTCILLCCGAGICAVPTWAAVTWSVWTKACTQIKTPVTSNTHHTVHFSELLVKSNYFTILFWNSENIRKNLSKFSNELGRDNLLLTLEDIEKWREIL